jgi:hypothetical protein
MPSFFLTTNPYQSQIVRVSLCGQCHADNLVGHRSPDQPELFSWIVDEQLHIHFFLQKQKHVLLLANLNLLGIMKMMKAQIKNNNDHSFK